MYFRADVREKRLLEIVRNIMNICKIKEAPNGVCHALTVCDEYSAEKYVADGVCVILYRDGSYVEDEYSDSDNVILLHVPFELERLMNAIYEYGTVSMRTNCGMMAFDDEVCVEGTGAALFTVNPKSRLIKSGDAEVRLTAREYAIFECLYTNLGEVVEREDIMQKVWKKTTATNVVDVYICYLRQKLACVLPSANLVAVRGTGYILKI